MKKDSYLQYIGFVRTANLWDNDALAGLQQFQHSSTLFETDNTAIFNEIRLGKRVEQFLNFQLKNTSNTKILAENIQIKIEKQTIGELDILIINDKKALHIETVYKFYLYDETITSHNSIEKWIGPNRKDTFTYKLTKLKEKQLPLLYHKATLKTLVSLNIHPETIEQNVCFKAQLFLPFNNQNINISPFNTSAIYGFYLSFERLNELKLYQFYIPKKLDWLIEPHNTILWQSFETITKNLKPFILEKRSPMLWLKSTNGKLIKCFITWW